MGLTPKFNPTPQSGVLGTDGKEQRVDFKPDNFDRLIESKGYRVAWSRAAQCPCNSVNDQTDQSDFNCPLCEGAGWFYFPPSEPVVAELAGDLDAVQQAILTRNNAAVIRGMMTSGSQEFDPYNKIVNWTEGEMMLTVRAANKVGYYDKITNLDSEIQYSELRDTDGTGLLPLRYLATGVNIIRSVDTVYVVESDYDLCEDGTVTWRTGKEPTTGTKVVCHYLMHPTWLVTKHPHVLRTTQVKFKTATPKTPSGDPRPLPVQAVVKLDFIP